MSHILLHRLLTPQLCRFPLLHLRDPCGVYLRNLRDLRDTRNEKDLKRNKSVQEALTLDELFEKILDDRGREKADRKANPTQVLFRDDQAFFKGYMGPKGASKTSTVVGSGLMRGLVAPGSEGFIARNDYNDLETTTGKRLMEMIGRLPQGALLDRNMKPPAKLYIQGFPILSPEGDILDDRPFVITYLGVEAIEAGGSLEFNWGAVDEMDECEEANIRIMAGWMRHSGGDYCIMGAWNPTDMFHWLYPACTGLDHENRSVGEPWIKLFLPQPGENQRNLPEDYYAQQAKTMTEDQKVRYIQGKWGGSFKGRPVVPEFKMMIGATAWHGRANLMKRYDKWAPVFRFLDFGYRHPCCHWSFMDWMGRLHTVKEFMGSDMEIENFIDACTAKEKQWFPEQHLKGKGGFINYGDPAARQKKDTGSTLQVLQARGWHLNYKITSIEEGLQSIRINMNKVVDGEPQLQIDSEGCPILCAALRGGYHRDEKTGHKPVKDGFYDHPVDDYRYGIVGLFGVVDAAKMMEGLPRSLEYNPSMDPHAGRR